MCPRMPLWLSPITTGGHPLRNTSFSDFISHTPRAWDWFTCTGDLTSPFKLLRDSHYFAVLFLLRLTFLSVYLLLFDFPVYDLGLFQTLVILCRLPLWPCYWISFSVPWLPPAPTLACYCLLYWITSVISDTIDRLLLVWLWDCFNKAANGSACLWPIITVWHEFQNKFNCFYSPTYLQDNKNTIWPHPCILWWQ